MTELLDAVSSLLAEVVAEEVLPRHRRLAEGDVVAKATPGVADDVVSIVDRAVEARLSPALAALLPGAEVIGEEAVHANPSLLERASSADAVFWVDPIDGTRTFVDGGDAYGVMIALVRRGVTCAAWITLPARDERYVAERGAGALRNGERLRVPARAGGPLRGTVYTGFLAGALRATYSAWPADHHVRVTPSGCAAVEYTGLARGAKDFVAYHRLLPWDHAPGALILTEAGGVTSRGNGEPYSTAARNELLVGAASADIARRIVADFAALRSSRP